MKIAFFADDGNFHFLRDIISHLSKEHLVRIFQKGTIQDMYDLMRWSDVSWFEWCGRSIVRASWLPKVCRIICRLHRYEAYTNRIFGINWDNVDDLIFVARHVLDTVKLQIPDIDQRVKTHIIPNGINLECFKFKNRKKGFNIAFLGNVVLIKNPMLLLQCMRKIVDKDPRYKCFIGGPFKELFVKQYLEQMIKEMQLQGNVFLQGPIKNVPQWFDDKSFLISTSVIEGHPVGIMEAMATGIKPIIHNFYGASEIYPRKYLFNTIDECCDMVLSDDYNPQEYRKFIEDNYSLQAQLDRIEELLNIHRVYLPVPSSVPMRLKESAKFVYWTYLRNQLLRRIISWVWSGLRWMYR